MARQQLPPQIKKKTVRDRKTGKPAVRYEITADAGMNPDTGKRQQVRRRYATERMARDALAELQSSVTSGTFVSRSTLTVEQACADWLAGRHGIRPTTRAAYEHSLAPLRARHGELEVQQLTKGHLDQLVADLIAGRCPGQRKGWTAGSVNPMLNHVSAVLSGLVSEGLLVRDVAALIDRLKKPRQKLATFTEEEARKLLAHVERDRLGHAWHLALSGLRRGELGGLRWSDIDLLTGTVAIIHNRVSVNGQAMDSQPKTEDSARVLPLTPALTSALRRALAIQKIERLALGPDYGLGEHVVCDQVGRPYHPDTLSDFWRALCIDAKVPRIRLHDARHTCGTLMHMQGVPIVVISQWLGHADPAFTMRTYVHSQDEALKLAAESLQRVVTPS
ncbi:MAG: site-specific integrase [Actinomycetia bacterium]|nr:site-specific integrase [Actinomycetes bacterium]MCH9734957.1 site-specific integrase [Actinomycetes bacterium]